MKHPKLLMLTLGVGIAVASTVFSAGGQPVQHVFQAGQKAVASEVNANFQELADRIAAIPGNTVYDLGNFLGSNVTQKVFAIKGFCNGGAVGTDTINFARTPVAGGTQITETQVRNVGGVCEYRVFERMRTPTSYYFTKVTQYDTTGTSVQYTLDFLSPVPLLTSAMTMGGSWGGGTESTRTPAGTDIGLVQNSTLLAIEDVTVAAGSFTGCLKVGVLRSSTAIGVFSGIQWYCPNVGLTKEIRHLLNSVPTGLATRELQSYTSN